MFADDINPFPAHLTAMNLAMRDVRYPTSEMNVIVEDFFKLRPKQKILMPYVVKTPAGEIRRQVNIPKVDAVVANPPYTRWVEILEETREGITEVIGEKLKRHRLTGGIGRETGIYVHFIMYAHDFLKKNGRLAMIISNSWLQSDYGVNFANFLLDHFKVRGVIDFNQRLFRIPLIATCVLLLEKEENTKKRNENKTIFLYVNEEAKVEEILDALENPDGWKKRFLINVVRQKVLSRDQKWIKFLFKTDAMEKIVKSSPLVIEVKNFFEPRYGNLLGVSARGGTGADKFFYLTRKDIEKWHLENYSYPLLVRPRYSKFFTFTREDWKKLMVADKPSYVFICHEPRDKLSKSVDDFIRYGETTPLVRVKEGEEPKTANESMASRTRERNRRRFFGWYDLSNFERTPLFTSRRAQYHHRFCLAESPMAFDDGLITFIPKKRINLSNIQFSALSAYLNSDVSRFFIEIYGRSTGGGVIELDTKSAQKIPIIDVRKLEKEQLQEMSSLFEDLEKEARKIKGADTQENLQKLQPIINEIDVTVAKILGFEKEFVDNLPSVVRIMADRRISRTERAIPETVKGEEEPRIKPPKKRRRRTTNEKPSTPLTKWMPNQNCSQQHNIGVGD